MNCVLSYWGSLEPAKSAKTSSTCATSMAPGGRAGPVRQKWSSRGTGRCWCLAACEFRQAV